MARKTDSANEIFKSLGGKKKQKDKGGGAKKYGRNRVKCAKYRSRVGKPNGRGQVGNKRGRNHSKA